MSAGPALYLVGTPIGNLEDITLRALRVLKEVDVIACEDTRQTQKLLNHYGITTRTISYHEHNEMTRAAELVKEMQEGASVALVTDAGMPGISDPGFRLISLAIRHHLPVVPIPGASAFLAALVASEVLVTLNAATVVQPYLPTRYWLAWIDFFRQPIFWRDIQRGFAIQAVYVVIFLAAAWANFSTKDITA